MGTVVVALVALGMLATLAMLGTARLRTCARWVGVQGLAFALLPLFVHHDGFTLRVGLLIAGNAVLKGFAFPVLLLRLCRKLTVRRELAPFVGFPAAILLGVATLGLSAWLGAGVSSAVGRPTNMLFVTSFFLIFSGLTLLITRREAVMQVIGFLTLESGIYVFGTAVVIWTPLLVELGVLLDVFVAVLVMGIAIDLIHVELVTTDVARLNALKG